MPKTKAVLVLRRDVRLVEPRDLLECLFPRRPHYVEIAMRLLPLIASGKINRTAYKWVTRELGVPKTTYYYVLGRLRAAGLVYYDSESGRYALSSRFSVNLRKMAEYWEGLAEKLKSEAS